MPGTIRWGVKRGQFLAEDRILETGGDSAVSSFASAAKIGDVARHAERSSHRSIGQPKTKLLTAEEVARMLDVSTAWVYDHAGRKRPFIPVVRLGKAVRFRPEDIDQFIIAMMRNQPW